MKKVSTFDEAIELLKQEQILVSTSFGGPLTFYYLSNGCITIRNDNLKAKISLMDFQDAFLKGEFYLYEVQNEVEIDQNDRYWRQ